MNIALTFKICRHEFQANYLAQAYYKKGDPNFEMLRIIFNEEEAEDDHDGGEGDNWTWVNLKFEFLFAMFISVFGLFHLHRVSILRVQFIKADYFCLK